MERELRYAGVAPGLNMASLNIWWVPGLSVEDRAGDGHLEIEVDTDLEHKATFHLSKSEVRAVFAEELREDELRRALLAEHKIAGRIGPLSPTDVFQAHQTAWLIAEQARTALSKESE